MSAQHHETQRDVEAALAARADLGPEYEPHIAAGLADRVEQLAAYRAAELRHGTETSRVQAQESHRSQTQRFVLGIISLGVGIPITGISVVQGGLAETVVSWAGLVGINAVFAWGNRKNKER